MRTASPSDSDKFPPGGAQIYEVNEWFGSPHRSNPRMYKRKRKKKKKKKGGSLGSKRKRAGEGVCKLLCCAVLCSCSCNVGLVSRDRTDWPKSKKVRPPLPPRAKLRHAMKTVSVHRTVYYRAGTFYWGGWIIMYVYGCALYYSA